MTLGFIAAFDDTLSTVIISSNGIHPLLDALTNEHEDHIKSASVWSLGQIGRHSPVHALAVAEAGVLSKLVLNFLSSSSSEDLQTKCRKALKAVIEHLIHLPALDSLLQGPSLPESTLKLVLAQLAKILPLDPDLRTKFVTSGGFEKLQQLPIGPESDLKDFLNSINNAYPFEIVQYYSPGYSEVLLQKLTTGKLSAVGI
ncbi:hypothetical protein O6H91_14G054700 [Diphasiastrum complanatum]|uniref:Uncharacterized protein n=1 Tax=Diphasiastrum complanatum TaxID=34168 RepID=A0ACC2BPM8_DIPCM|nr:hypothetical protein O6H91_14G054700 [Diphasiastrum complanatum]